MVWITCGLLWCFYQLFGLSFWRHPFTAEHPLMSDVMLHFSKSDEETNSSTSWMAWWWAHSANFHFWVKYHKLNIICINIKLNKNLFKFLGWKFSAVPFCEVLKKTQKNDSFMNWFIYAHHMNLVLCKHILIDIVLITWMTRNGLNWEVCWWFPFLCIRQAVNGLWTRGLLPDPSPTGPEILLGFGSGSG